jgi:hypothetical protein
MFNMLRHAALGTWLLTITLVYSAPASAQAPTDAQRSAIRSACRADYEAHCSSIQPGGMASLQCLQQNMSSLSSSCQTAVRAVEAPAAPKESEKAEPTPRESEKAASPAAGTPEKPAANTAAPPANAAGAAKEPSSAQIAGIRSACRADYQKTCASVPTGGAAARNCLEKNKSELSPKCQQAVNAAGSGGGAAKPTAGSAPPAGTADAPPADAPAPALVLRPMRPREVLLVLRSACGGDVRALCAGVPVGGGRIIECLATQSASLSPACRDVLGQFAQ